MFRQQVTSTDSSVGPEVPPPNPQPAVKRPLPFWLLLYIFPLIDAINDGSQTAMGVKEKDQALAYTTIAMTLLLSFSINAKFTVEGMKETYRFARHSLLPEDLTPIANKKRNIAIGVALAITLYVTFSDAVQAYFYSDSIPEEYHFKLHNWKVFAGIIAINSAIIVFFNEGFKNYRYLHEKFSNHSFAYTNSVSRVVSPALGVTLGTVSSLTDILSSVVGMASVSNARKPSSLAAIGITGIVCGISNYTLMSYFFKSTSDALIHTLSRRRPTASEMVSLSTALAISAYASIVTRELACTLFNDATNFVGAHPSDTTERVCTAYSWINAMTDITSGSICLFPLTSAFTHFLIDLADVIHSNVVSRKKVHARDGQTLRDANSELEPLLTNTSPLATNNIRLFDYTRPRLGFRIEDEMRSYIV